MVGDGGEGDAAGVLRELVLERSANALGDDDDSGKLLGMESGCEKAGSELKAEGLGVYIHIYK
jgi:hypothetical protein